MTMFGADTLYNHLEQKNLRYYSGKGTSPYLNGLPFSTFPETHFEVIQSVELGNELFSFYGSKWFSDKDIPVEEKFPSAVPKKQITTEELHQYGHCLSYVGSDLSRVPLAGRGLFAHKAFEAGEVVTVSPVLVLERNLVEQTRDSSLLINYCYSHPSTDAVFLPLGVAALINGNYSSDNKSNSANVEVGWYDWSQLLTPDTPGHIADSLRALNLTEKLETDLQELYEAPFAQVDFQFVATRDIAEGEEILADYGEQWRNTWSEYIDLLNQPVVNGDAGTCDMAENQRSTNIRYQASKWQILMQSMVEQFRNSAAPSSLPADFPQFRQFITLPETIIPQKWKNGNRKILNVA